MLCPITDRGPRRLYYEEFVQECTRNLEEEVCVGCEAGTLLKMGKTVTRFPKAITITDVNTVVARIQNNEGAKAKKARRKPSEEHFPGNEKLKPIPHAALKKLTMSGLRAYWKKQPIPMSGVVEACINCDRELRITAGGLCGMCYNNARNQSGQDVILALDNTRAKARTMNLKNSPSRKQKLEDPSESTPNQRILIRRKGDLSFSEGVIELFVSENGKLCVSVNRGFDVLLVSQQYHETG